MSGPNMLKLEPSRKKPKAGDVFAVKYPAAGYVFGRVAAANLPIELGGMPGANLLYFHDHRSAESVPVRSELRIDRLLIAPVFTNRQGWLRGYYQTVEHFGH